MLFLEKTSHVSLSIDAVGSLTPNEELRRYLSAASLKFDPNDVRISLHFSYTNTRSDREVIEHARRVLGRYPPFELAGCARVRVDRGRPTFVPVERGAEWVEKLRYDLADGYPRYAAGIPQMILCPSLYGEEAWKIRPLPLKEAEYKLHVTEVVIEKSTDVNFPDTILDRIYLSPGVAAPLLDERQFPLELPMSEIETPGASRLRELLRGSMETRPSAFAFAQVPFDLYEASTFTISQLGCQLICSMGSAVDAYRIEWNPKCSTNGEQYLAELLTESLYCEYPNFEVLPSEFLGLVEAVFPGDRRFLQSWIDGSFPKFFRDDSLGIGDAGFLLHNRNRIMAGIVVGDD